LKEQKLALMQATAEANRPWLFESLEEDSNTNNDDNKL
jgi:hypothetical protein